VKRNRILLGLVGLVLAGAIQARADTPDALRDAATVALQKLDQFVAKEWARLKDDARATRDVGVQLNSIAEQSALLNDRLKNQKDELEQKIGALDEQIKSLKEQAEKLEAIQRKITELMPTFMDAVGSDQGSEASQKILAAVSQDRARAIRLADAIEGRNADEVSSVLRRGVEGSRVQIGEIPEGEGATVNFRVGNLVHCLSTNKRCRGAVSSLGKTASHDAPDPDLLLKQLHSLAAAANRETATCNKRVEELLAKAAAGGPPGTDANRAADLQRLMAKLVTLQSTASQQSRDIAVAMDRVIRRT
jgi:chaperonin cofactor prefoldin